MTPIGYCKTALLSSTRGECKPCTGIWWSISIVGSTLFILGMLIACCCCFCCLASVAKSDMEKKSKRGPPGETIPPPSRKQMASKLSTEIWNNFLVTMYLRKTSLTDEDSLTTSILTHSTNRGTDGYEFANYPLYCLHTFLTYLNSYHNFLDHVRITINHLN
jgi:hypothetical protein